MEWQRDGETITSFSPPPGSKGPNYPSAPLLPPPCVLLSPFEPTRKLYSTLRPAECELRPPNRGRTVLVVSEHSTQTNLPNTEICFLSPSIKGQFLEFSVVFVLLAVTLFYHFSSCYRYSDISSLFGCLYYFPYSIRMIHVYFFPPRFCVIIITHFACSNFME